MKKYILETEDDFHRKWKIYSTANGQTMKDFCLEAMQEKMDSIEEVINDGRGHSGDVNREN